MSWDANKTEGKTETKVEVDKPVEAVEVKQETAEAKEDTKETEVQPLETKDEPLEPAKIGKAFKTLREKNKEKLTAADQKIRDLEEQVKRLSVQQETQVPDPVEEEENLRISKKVDEEFLKRQDRYGREKFGDQNFSDAFNLIRQQNNPLLEQKIRSAVSPADTLMSEALRILDEQELGETPEERERNKEKKIREKVRKEVESEFAAKFKAQANQPTDVQKVRAAGGDVRPNTRDTWTSGRSTLPK